MAEPPVVVEFSIRLSNGHFESHVQVALAATESEKRAAVEQWLAVMLRVLPLLPERASTEPQK